MAGFLVVLQLITMFAKKDYMKRSAYFLGTLLVSVSIGFFAGVSHNKTLSQSASKMCIIDSYAHEEYYSKLSKKQRLAKDLTYACIGIGITCLNPVVGGIYGF